MASFAECNSLRAQAFESMESPKCTDSPGSPKFTRIASYTESIESPELTRITSCSSPNYSDQNLYAQSRSELPPKFQSYSDRAASEVSKCRTAATHTTSTSRSTYRRAVLVRTLSNTRTNDQIALHALNFHEDEADLLRGTPLKSILRGRAEVLSDNYGNSASYALSRAVSRLDYFLSHNWSMPRHTKFLTLCLHFNLMFACVAAFVVSILCFLLQANDLLPMRSSTSWADSNIKVGSFSHLLSTPVFFIVLFTKHELCGNGNRSPMCFLDKTCINQMDEIVKHKSIEKLGAFLNNSDRILVLYSNTYLKKLWTIYEVACFSVLRPSECIEVVQTSCVKLYFAFMVIGYFISCLFYVNTSLPFVYNLLVYSIVALVYVKFARLISRELACTWNLVKTFDVKKATCFDEADRPVVEKNIAAFMVAKRFTNPDADKNEALQAFNGFVASFVFQCMRTSLTSSPVKYTHLVLFCLLINFTSTLDVASGMVLAYGVSDMRPWRYMLITFAVSVAHMPLAAETSGWIMKSAPGLSGWREWLLIVVGAIILVTICIAAERVGAVVSSLSEKSVAYSCILVAFESFCIALSVGFEIRRRRNNKLMATNLDSQAKTVCDFANIHHDYERSVAQSGRRLTSESASSGSTGTLASHATSNLQDVREHFEFLQCSADAYANATSKVARAPLPLGKFIL